MISPTTCIWKATSLHYQSDKSKSHPSKFYFMRIILMKSVLWCDRSFSQQHPSLCVIISQHCKTRNETLRFEVLGEYLQLFMQDAWSSDIFESAHSPTAEFGQRNASIQLSLKGRSPKQAVKTGCLKKLQSCKSQGLLQVLTYLSSLHKNIDFFFFF